MSTAKIKNNLRTVIIIVFLSGLTLTTSCHRKTHEDKGPRLPVTHPLKSDQTITKEYVAQVKAIQHIELRAFEKGYLQNIFVDEGQMVTKGQKMFEIMPTINKAEYNKAKAELDLVKMEYRNTQSLAQQNVVSSNELALAKAKYQKAQAELDLAQVHLDLTEIKAPFDGLMDRFHVRLGSLIEEGELLTTLSDNSKMWVYFNVSESDYLDYKSRENDTNTTEVKLRLANGKIFDQNGTIDTIEADFNNETGNIAFRATFANPKGLLRHGETGSILISLPLKDVLVIPQKSTFEILDKKFVYIVDEKNKIQSRQIVVQEELPHLYVLSSGLSENEKFLLDGIGKVEQGQLINPDFQDPKKVVTELDVHAE